MNFLLVASAVCLLCMLSGGAKAVNETQRWRSYECYVCSVNGDDEESKKCKDPTAYSREETKDILSQCEYGCMEGYWNFVYHRKCIPFVRRREMCRRQRCCRYNRCNSTRARPYWKYLIMSIVVAAVCIVGGLVAAICFLRYLAQGRVTHGNQGGVFPGQTYPQQGGALPTPSYSQAGGDFPAQPSNQTGGVPAQPYPQQGGFPAQSYPQQGGFPAQSYPQLGFGQPSLGSYHTLPSMNQEAPPPYPGN